jgi:hypothetical protein
MKLNSHKLATGFLIFTSPKSYCKYFMLGIYDKSYGEKIYKPGAAIL